MHSCKNQQQKWILLQNLLSIITWTYLILYCRRHKFYCLHAVVIKTHASWANYIRHFLRKCSNLVWILSHFYLARTAFCLLYLLPEKDPIECIFFTNLEMAEEGGTQDTKLLMQKPSYTWFMWFIFYIYILQKDMLFKCIYNYLNSILQEAPWTNLWELPHKES